MNCRDTTIFSAAVNLGLAAAIVFFWLSDARPPVGSENDEILAPDPVIRFPVAEEIETPVSVEARFTWAEIESDDYLIYMANLREFGCPDWLVADLIRADIEKLFDRKIRRLRWSPDHWMTSRQVRAGELERSRRRNALKQQKRATLQSLLGSPVSHEIMTEARNLDRDEVVMLGFLGDNNAGRVVDLVEHFRDEVSVFEEARHNIITTGDREWLNHAFATFMANIDAALGEVAAEEMWLRVQIYALEYESGLSAFRSVARTPQELRELAGIVFDEGNLIRSELFGLDDDEEEASEEREMRVNQAIADFLGPERYVEFELEQDASFREMRKFTDGHQLDRRVAIELHTVVNQARSEIESVKAMTGLSETQRTRIATQIRNAAMRSVQPLLGGAYGDFERQHSAVFGTDQ